VWPLLFARCEGVRCLGVLDKITAVLLLQVAIKKINNVFDHVSDATRILREIKLLRLLRHPGADQIPAIGFDAVALLSL
jgi:hypothetical protein